MLADNVRELSGLGAARENVDVHILSPHERMAPMQPREKGYFHARSRRCSGGHTVSVPAERQARSGPIPLPRFSRKACMGPHRLSSIASTGAMPPGAAFRFANMCSTNFTWERSRPEGTFDAIIPRIADLKELGITAIEIMPVAQFPGNATGAMTACIRLRCRTPTAARQALKRLVNACHAQGMAVVLDVVYNHLGPEGNYAGEFGFYFTDAYKTPWGAALNFDQEYSDEVRRYFIENALRWIADFHIDGLRLDAIHAIVDPSARPFVAGACARHATNERRELNREVQIIAESNRNDGEVVMPRGRGGWALDASGTTIFIIRSGSRSLARKPATTRILRAYRIWRRRCARDFVYDGQYSNFRKRRYGNSSRDLAGEAIRRFFAKPRSGGQSQSGRPPQRSRFFRAVEAGGGRGLLSPYVPLLFMGEEYGEKAPFQYFVSHGDPGIIEAVRKRRGEEFASFEWAGELPDPQDEGTFLRFQAGLGFAETRGEHRVLLEFYRELLRLRREMPALAQLDKHSQQVSNSREWKTHLRSAKGKPQPHRGPVLFRRCALPVRIAASCGPLGSSAGFRRTAVEWSGSRTTQRARILRQCTAGPKALVGLGLGLVAIAHRVLPVHHNRPENPVPRRFPVPRILPPYRGDEVEFASRNTTVTSFTLSMARPSRIVGAYRHSRTASRAAGISMGGPLNRCTISTRPT